MTPVGSSVRINLKVISTRSAEIHAATGISIPLTADIRSLLDESVGGRPARATAGKKDSTPPRGKPAPYEGMEFNHRGVRVRLRGLTVTGGDSPEIIVTLEYSAAARNRILVALSPPPHYRGVYRDVPVHEFRTSLTDDRGRKYYFHDITGLSRAAILEPDNPIIVVMSFKVLDEYQRIRGPGSRFTLSSEQVTASGEALERLEQTVDLHIHTYDLKYQIADLSTQFTLFFQGIEAKSNH